MNGRQPVLYVIEPPAHYLARTPLILDCSAVAGIVFREAWEAAARQQIHGRSLHAPHLLSSEIASVALKKLRRGEAHAADGLAAVAAMEITLHRIEPVPVVELAYQYGLSAYDASYLWLAADLKCPLVTFDERLGTAARTHLSGLA